MPRFMISGKSWRFVACALLAVGGGVAPGSGLHGVCLATAGEAGGSDQANSDAMRLLKDALEKAGESGGGSVNVDIEHEFRGVSVGDLVSVQYTARLEDGSLVDATSEDVWKKEGQRKTQNGPLRGFFGPEDVVGGAPGEIVGLGEAVLGMSVGQKKTVSLPAEKAFGAFDEKLTSRFPREKRTPVTMEMSKGEFVKRNGMEPVKGAEVNMVPHVKGVVVKVDDSKATISFDAKDGLTVQDNIGSIAVHNDGKEITLRLNPTIGADFISGDKTGRITGFDDGSFTVDFNHPLAGKPIVIDMEVLSIKKGAELASVVAPWVEKDDEENKLVGIDGGKPTVFVVYSPNCGWCKRLFGETFGDPRIKALKDRFNWVRIDDDKHQAFVERRFDVDRYPVVFLMDRSGAVVDKIVGYRDAVVMREAMDKMLHGALPEHAGLASHEERRSL